MPYWRDLRDSEIYSVKGTLIPKKKSFPLSMCSWGWLQFIIEKRGHNTWTYYWKWLITATFVVRFSIFNVCSERFRSNSSELFRWYGVLKESSLCEWGDEFYLGPGFSFWGGFGMLDTKLTVLSFSLISKNWKTIMIRKWKLPWTIFADLLFFTVSFADSCFCSLTFDSCNDFFISPPYSFMSFYES